MNTEEILLESLLSDPALSATEGRLFFTLLRVFSEARASDEVVLPLCETLRSVLALDAVAVYGFAGDTARELHRLDPAALVWLPAELSLGALRLGRLRTGGRIELSRLVGGRSIAYVGLPFTAGRAVTGALMLFSEDPDLLKAQADLDFAQKLGLLAGLALERIALVTALEDSAQQDQTGLPMLRSKSSALAQLTQELTRAKRHGHPFSVIEIDIDHFKRVNDTYGHPVGDAILTTVANLLLECAPEESSIARMGGEEILVMLPETPAGSTPSEGAMEIASRMRERVARERFPQLTDRNLHDHHLTISLGVAGVGPSESLMAEALLARVDIALYAAKSAGRDNVQLWRADLQPRPESAL